MHSSQDGSGDMTNGLEGSNWLCGYSWPHCQQCLPDKRIPEHRQLQPLVIPLFMRAASLGELTLQWNPQGILPGVQRHDLHAVLNATRLDLRDQCVSSVRWIFAPGKSRINIRR